VHSALLLRFSTNYRTASSNTQLAWASYLHHYASESLFLCFANQYYHVLLSLQLSADYLALCRYKVVPAAAAAVDQIFTYFPLLL
jgi:hypothetical protein